MARKKWQKFPLGERIIKIIVILVCYTNCFVIRRISATFPLSVWNVLGIALNDDQRTNNTIKDELPLKKINCLLNF